MHVYDLLPADELNQPVHVDVELVLRLAVDRIARHVTLHIHRSTQRRATAGADCSLALDDLG